MFLSCLISYKPTLPDEERYDSINITKVTLSYHDNSVDDNSSKSKNWNQSVGNYSMEPSKSDLSSCLYKNKCFFTKKSLHQLILNHSYFLLNPKNTLLFINENVHHNNSGTCMFDLMLNRSYIIESQTAWVILSHKGYLEVNLTRNNYDRLKILSAREEKKNIRNKF